MLPWLFSRYMDTTMKEVKIGIGRMGVTFVGMWREQRLPILFYPGDLVLCGKPEENLRAMVRHLFEVCRRTGLKVNVDKIKVMVLNGEEGLV